MSGRGISIHIEGSDAYNYVDCIKDEADNKVSGRRLQPVLPMVRDRRAPSLDSASSAEFAPVVHSEEPQSSPPDISHLSVDDVCHKLEMLNLGEDSFNINMLGFFKTNVSLFSAVFIGLWVKVMGSLKPKMCKC